MDSTDIRRNLFDHHPLFTSSEVLITPPIQELFIRIFRVIKLREPGCCITGPSGIGKTYALNMVHDMLKAKMPKLVIYEHDAQNQQIPSIRAFFKHFLNTVSHNESKRGETYELRLRLTNRIIDDTRASGIDACVLFIDEAQAMSIQDFLFLKDVYNSLDREGVKLITVMMGQQPDFQIILDRLRSERRLDLMARFTMRHSPFRALSTLEDLDIILNGIDTAIYPPETDWTWTQLFFPKAYESGFRLRNEAKRFIEALNHAGDKGIGHQFPARQCFLAIRALILECSGLDAENMRLPDDAWKNAIQYARIDEARALIEGTAPKTIQVQT